MTICFEDDFEFDLDFSSSDGNERFSNTLLIENYLTDEKLIQFTQDVFLPMPLGEDKTLAIDRVKALIELLKIHDDIEHLVAGVSSDAEFKWCLFVIIKLSSVVYEVFPEIALVASRAMTILNRAKISFSAMKLNNIHIPYANISSGVFDTTVMPGADLDFSVAKQVWLNNAVVSGSKMNDIDFNELRHIPVRDDVSCCAYSPDGLFILVASEIWLTLYDAMTLRPVQAFNGHQATVNSAEYSPNGNYIVSGSGFAFGGERDNTARIWDAKSGLEVKRFTQHNKAVMSVAFSSDNISVISGDWDGALFLWSLSHDNICHLVGHTEGIDSLAFSPNTKFIASGSSDKSVRVWDALEKKQTHKFNAETLIISVAISFNNHLVAAGGRSGKIFVWDLPSGELYFCFQQAHRWFVNSLAFSPNGQWLASGSKDQSVKVWDLAEKKIYINSLSHALPVTSIAFHPNSQFLIAGTGTSTREESNEIKVVIWDLKKESTALNLSKESTRGYISCISVSPDGQLCVIGTGNGTGSEGQTQIWSIKTGGIYKELNDGCSGSVNCVAWSPDGKWIATAGDNGRFDLHKALEEIKSDNDIRLWDTETGVLIKKLGQCIIHGDVIDGHLMEVTALAFASHSQFLVSAGEDGKVLLWYINDGIICRIYANQEQIMARHQAKEPFGISAIAYSSNNEFIVAAGGDKVIRIWEALSSEEKQVLVGHDHKVTSLILSEDDKQLVSASDDNTVRVWKIETAEQLLLLNLHDVKWGLGGFANKIFYKMSVAVSPDKKNIVVGYKGQLTVYDLITSKMKFSVTLSSSIHSLAWSGVFLLVGGSAFSLWQYHNSRLVLLRFFLRGNALSAENCQIENMLDMSEKNRYLLIEHGAAQSKRELRENLQASQFYSMSPREISEKLLLYTADKKFEATALYQKLVIRAIKLRAHLAQDRLGNTALHLAILSKQFDKILVLLRAIEAKDEKLSPVLEIVNAYNRIPVHLLTEYQINLLEVKELTQKIVYRKLYHQMKSSAEYNNFSQWCSSKKSKAASSNLEEKTSTEHQQRHYGSGFNPGFLNASNVGKDAGVNQQLPKSKC